MGPATGLPAGPLRYIAMYEKAMKLRKTDECNGGEGPREPRETEVESGRGNVGGVWDIVLAGGRVLERPESSLSTEKRAKDKTTLRGLGKNLGAACSGYGGDKTVAIEQLGRQSPPDSRNRRTIVMKQGQNATIAGDMRPRISSRTYGRRRGAPESTVGKLPQ